MPFTPFHFGPGLLIKGIAPRHVSVTAFVAANVAIDLESLYNLQRGAWPIHTHLHTFLGAALTGLATVVVLVLVRWEPVPTTTAEVTLGGIVIGAMLGASRIRCSMG